MAPEHVIKHKIHQEDNSHHAQEPVNAEIILNIEHYRRYNNKSSGRTQHELKAMQAFRPVTELPHAMIQALNALPPICKTELVQFNTLPGRRLYAGNPGRHSMPNAVIDAVLHIAVSYLARELIKIPKPLPVHAVVHGMPYHLPDYLLAQPPVLIAPDFITQRDGASQILICHPCILTLLLRLLNKKYLNTEQQYL